MARINEWGYYEYTKKLHKLKRKGYKLEQILIVDDTPAKPAFNYGNAIYIKPFTGSPTDSELLNLCNTCLP
jgi:RNA polymerase II subunit A small phosphatase-like protein